MIYTCLFLPRGFMNNNPRSVFQHETDRSCLAYAHPEPNDKASTMEELGKMRQWKDVDCNTKAPFICEYNKGAIMAFNFESDYAIPYFFPLAIHRLLGIPSPE